MYQFEQCDSLGEGTDGGAAIFWLETINPVHSLQSSPWDTSASRWGSAVSLLFGLAFSSIVRQQSHSSCHIPTSSNKSNFSRTRLQLLFPTVDKMPRFGLSRIAKASLTWPWCLYIAKSSRSSSRVWIALGGLRSSFCAKLLACNIFLWWISPTNRISRHLRGSFGDHLEGQWSK